MITLEKIPFTSVAGQPLTLYLWQTDAPCRGVIQLVHGMAEHIARYDRLARALCAAGYTCLLYTSKIFTFFPPRRSPCRPRRAAQGRGPG